MFVLEPNQISSVCLGSTDVVWMNKTHRRQRHTEPDSDDWLNFTYTHVFLQLYVVSVEVVVSWEDVSRIAYR